MNAKEVEQKAEAWLDLLNDLEKLGLQEELPIPQIAVIGDQSSGKSSLLESISGIPFPKGSGLVTKHPIKITIVSLPNGPWSGCVALPLSMQHLSTEIQRKVDSPAALAVALSKATVIVAENTKSDVITRNTVHVTIESPDLPNLSLVDLPGIVRTATVGQRDYIVREVDELLDSFMRLPETIILAVVPANQDVATIDVLERASRFDPSGVRTLGVVTKPDLVDEGGEEEVLAVLQNKRKVLSFGYYVVRNRNQLELNENMSLSEAAEREELYLNTHDVWKKVDPARKGIRALCSKLSDIIVKRATDRGPNIKWMLQEKVKQTDSVLKSLGSSESLGYSEKSTLIMRLLSEFATALRKSVEGDYRGEHMIENADLHIKGRVSRILAELKKALAAEIPDLKSLEYEKRLSTGICELRGRELPGFGSTRALLSTVSAELESWRMHVDGAFADISTMYTRTTKLLACKIASQYPVLLEEVSKCIDENMAERIAEIEKRVDEIIVRSTECASMDADLIQSIESIRFSRFEAALQEVLATAPPPPPTASSTAQAQVAGSFIMKQHLMEVLAPVYMRYHSLSHGPTLHVDDARAALEAFWRISETRLNDDVISAVDLLLLQQCNEQIERQLYATAQLWLADPEVLDRIMAESPAISQKRAAMLESKKSFEKALKKLDGILPNCRSSSS